MTGAVGALYERLIERDLDAVPAAARAFTDPDELFLAVARFSVLAYAPSLHSKHAVLCALAAHQMRQASGPGWTRLLVECARYAAESRQPWSEPPLLEPPDISTDQPAERAALREAVEARDRLAAERWLAARLESGDPADDLYSVAADDFEDLGLKLIVTVAAVRLAALLGARGRYAALRLAVWELCSAERGGSGPGPGAPASDPARLRDLLVGNAIAERGSPDSVLAVFLHDAARETCVYDRTCAYLQSLSLRSPAIEPAVVEHFSSYRLARDYGQHLRAFAIGDLRLASATADNLANAASFAEWSLA